MNKYMPEGALISTLKNREYTSSIEGLEAAQEKDRPDIILDDAKALEDLIFA